MKPIGSLYDFVQPLKKTMKTERSQNTDIKHQQNSRKAQQRRLKTTLDKYIASDKKLLIRNLDNGQKNRQQVEKWKNEYDRYKLKKSKLQNHSILMPKKIQIIQLQTKNRLNMDQGLLRAIQRLEKSGQKREQQQNKCQTSFANYTRKLSQIKMAPLLNFNGLHLNEQKPSSLIRFKQTKRKQSLSDTKRIEFQICLSWAKKHNKNGSYYYKSLGKQKESYDWHEQVVKRKKVLSGLSQKHPQHKQRNSFSHH